MTNADEPPSYAVRRALANSIEVKAVQTLIGMVTGIVADGQLHDLEIGLLSTWLSDNRVATVQWPGSVIAAQVRQALADGKITEAEREHLLGLLREMAFTDFANTGSASPEPIRLPVDDAVTLQLNYAGIVHTGTFLYGTRAACERLSMAMGAVPMDSVTKGTDVLVIGGRVTPGWVTESWGRKIKRGEELRAEGHRICIVSERKWFEHARTLGHV